MNADIHLLTFKNSVLGSQKTHCTFISDLQVNVIWENDHCLFSELYETHECTLMARLQKSVVLKQVACAVTNTLQDRIRQANQ